MHIVLLEGDQTGQELLQDAIRVLEPDLIGLPITFDRYDLSLATRRLTQNGVVREAADALRTHRYGIKAATITPEVPGDVGSPNALLREWIDATVILRTGRRIPGVRPVAGVVAPIAVVRMAVGDAYNAREWREGAGDDEVAFRTTRITRRHCRVVAEFTFVTPVCWAPRSSADPSTPSVRCTKACSRKRWTRGRSATPTFPTILS